MGGNSGYGIGSEYSVANQSYEFGAENFNRMGGMGADQYMMSGGAAGGMGLGGRGGEYLQAGQNTGYGPYGDRWTSPGGQQANPNIYQQF